MKQHWTTDDIGDMTGKVVIVTGGNTGLGFEAVQIYAGKGAGVIMACRDMDKAKAAAGKILAAHSGADVVPMLLDLSDLKSIRTFAKKFAGKYKRLDILLNNAGVMASPYCTTSDGFEQQLGVNHLGHFALTGLLMDVLKKTAGSRVVNISSNAHRMGRMDFDNLMCEDGRGYSPMKAYGQSKLANLLFTYEMQRRAQKAGLDMRILAAHPGGANTELARHYEGRAFYKLFGWVWPMMAQSAYDGALPGVRASVDEDAAGGTYYGPDGRMGMKGKPVLVSASKAANSEEDAGRLWEESEKLTGVTYDFR